MRNGLNCDDIVAEILKERQPIIIELDGSPAMILLEREYWVEGKNPLRKDKQGYAEVIVQLCENEKDGREFIRKFRISDPRPEVHVPIKLWYDGESNRESFPQAYKHSDLRDRIIPSFRSKPGLAMQIVYRDNPDFIGSFNPINDYGLSLSPKKMD